MGPSLPLLFSIMQSKRCALKRKRAHCPSNTNAKHCRVCLFAYQSLVVHYFCFLFTLVYILRNSVWSFLNDFFVSLLSFWALKILKSVCTWSKSSFSISTAAHCRKLRRSALRTKTEQKSKKWPEIISLF